MDFTTLIQNLKYRIGDKGYEHVDSIQNGVTPDLHGFILVSNLFDHLQGYDPSGEYTEEINETYRQALLKLNNYLETNLDYEFN